MAEHLPCIELCYSLLMFQALHCSSKVKVLIFLKQFGATTSCRQSSWVGGHMMMSVLCGSSMSTTSPAASGDLGSGPRDPKASPTLGPPTPGSGAARRSRKVRVAPRDSEAMTGRTPSRVSRSAVTNDYVKPRRVAKKWTLQTSFIDRGTTK